MRNLIRILSLSTLLVVFAALTNPSRKAALSSNLRLEPPASSHVQLKPNAQPLIPGLAQDGGGNIFISRIDQFLNTCPGLDPAITEIRNDFQIRRNGALVATIPCTGNVSQLSAAQYTDELIVLQGLRVIYYMDRGKSGHLPWTTGTMYNWMKSRIKGLDIRDGSGSFCCEDFEGKLHVAIGAQNDFNREFDRKWEGIAGNVDLYAHEARHVDVPFHNSCCGVSNGCDQAYDLSNLSSYSVQYWLNKQWLTGEINVGFGCLPSTRVQEIQDWHRSAIDVFRQRLCDNRPPSFGVQTTPGGQCRASCTANATSVSAASFIGNELAPDSIAAVFGCEFSTTIQVVSSPALPTELAGARVSVRDVSGSTLPASLFFASPNQINYLLPATLANGPATVTVTNANGIVSSGSTLIFRVKPGIFTANATGQGLGATLGYRVQANGTQGYFDTVRFDLASQTFVPIPIDLGPAGDQVYLLLFGTGIRKTTPATSVVANIGGTPVTIAYAGPHGTYFGLDQVNVLIPRSLAGRGEVVVSLQAEARQANLITTNIK